MIFDLNKDDKRAIYLNIFPIFKFFCIVWDFLFNKFRFFIIDI